MIKKSGMTVLVLLFSLTVYGDIQFIAPANNASLTVGTNVQIQWSGPAAEASQLVTVFFSTTSESEIGIVSNTHTKGDGGFTWEVGRMQNGDLWKTSGTYKMWLESLDGDSGEHAITLVAQTFGLDHPAGGETLTIGTNFNIQWHGPTYEANQIVATFIYSVAEGWYKYVDNSHTKGQGGFTWEVGKLKDGTVVPPGQYSLSLESDDGDSNESPQITLVAPQLKIPLDKIYREWRVIIIFPDPPCPMCFRLDMKNIKILTQKIRDIHTVKLFKNNRMVMELGKVGPRNNLPGSAKITLNKNQMAKLRKHGKIQFQLRVFSQKGKLLHTQDILLKINQQDLLKLNKSKLQLQQ